MPLIPQVGREQLNVRLIMGVIAGVLWLGILLHLFPVWWMFITSIKPYYEVLKLPPTLWPTHPTFAVYRLFFRLGAGGWSIVQYPVKVYIKNSFIITGGTMLIQIPITCLMAYALSKLYDPRWSRLLLLVCIGTMLVPMQVSLIPRYLIMTHFPFPTKHIPNIPFTDIRFPTYDFINSYWAVILPATYNAFYLLLFKGFFDTIPSSLINAARLDGASELSIFRRIVLPLSKPVFAVTCYLSFSATWNSFLWPLIVIQKNKLYPLSVFLFRFQAALDMYAGDLASSGDPEIQRFVESGIGYNGIMAISIIQSIPVFIMFIIFREQLLAGIKLRGLK